MRREDFIALSRAKERSRVKGKGVERDFSFPLIGHQWCGEDEGNKSAIAAVGEQRERGLKEGP